MIYLKNLEEAMKYIEKALELDENYVDALNNKALILILQNNSEEALEIIEKILLLDNNHKEAYTLEQHALLHFQKRVCLSQTQLLLLF